MVCAARSMLSSSSTSTSSSLAAGVLDVDEHGAGARCAGSTGRDAGRLLTTITFEPRVAAGFFAAAARAGLAAGFAIFLATGLRVFARALVAGLRAVARRMGFFFVATSVYCQGRGVAVKGSGRRCGARASGVPRQRERDAARVPDEPPSCDRMERGSPDPLGVRSTPERATLMTTASRNVDASPIALRRAVRAERVWRPALRQINRSTAAARRGALHR